MHSWLFKYGIYSFAMFTSAEYTLGSLKCLLTFMSDKASAAILILFFTDNNYSIIIIYGSLINNTT